MDRKKLKLKAKNSLKDKYPDAVMMLILIYGINFGIGIIVGIIGGRLTAIGLQESITDILSQIASIIINGLFAFGYTSYFLKLSRNKEVTYNELFSKTHLFGHISLLVY